MNTPRDSEMFSGMDSQCVTIYGGEEELNLAKKPRLDASGTNLYISDEESNDLFQFNKLSECQCCARHKVGRPESLYSGWEGIVRVQYNFDAYACQCWCKCRQSMRFLARKYDSRWLRPAGGWTVSGWKDLVEIENNECINGLYKEKI